MCKSGPVSLVAYGVAAVIAIHVISRGKAFDKATGYFILVYITIQLLEFFIWVERERLGLSKSADEAMLQPDSQSNAKSSEFWTRLIFVALWLQPLAQTYLAYRFGDTRYSKQLAVVTIAYFALFIWAVAKATDTNVEFSSQPEVADACAKGHLWWSRGTNKDGFLGPAAWLYLFGLFFGLLFIQPKLYGKILIGFGLILAIYSSRNFSTREFSSMWCIYAVLWAVLVLIMSYGSR